MLLKKGTQNQNTVKLQAQLRALGHYDGLITGYFDQDTETAVKSYQKMKGLTVDGLAGKNTLRAVEKSAKDAYLFLYIHCSATAEGDTKKDANWVKWLHQTKKGWSRPGYSDVIEISGKLVNLRPYNQNAKIEDSEYTWGVKGQLMNRNARHFCYIGGVSADDYSKAKDTRTAPQKESMEIFIKYQLLRNPDVIVLGHNQVQRKACPSFAVPHYLRTIGVDERNIGHFELYK